MKCELAAALLHRPTTLFLDEPTIGLDVAMQVAIRDFVRSYNQRHEATVLLTSHYMDDVVALCPRIIVIDQGKLIHDGDLRQLIKTMDPDKRVSFTLVGAGRRRRAREARHACSRARASASRCASPSASSPSVVGHLLGTLKAADLAIEDPPLEDILRVMFGKPQEAQRSVVRSAPSRTLRALPTLLRIGVAETVAYRAEFLVWMLTTTMPLIMLGAVDERRERGAVRAATRRPTSSRTSSAR